MVAEPGATVARVPVSGYVARRRAERGLCRGRGAAVPCAGRGGRGGLRRVPRGGRRGAGEAVDIRDAAVTFGPAFHVAFATRRNTARPQLPADRSVGPVTRTVMADLRRKPRMRGFVRIAPDSAWTMLDLWRICRGHGRTVSDRCSHKGASLGPRQ